MQQLCFNSQTKAVKMLFLRFPEGYIRVSKARPQLDGYAPMCVLCLGSRLKLLSYEPFVL